MEIIAKTPEGALINATDEEIKAMVTAVTGETPDKIKVGLKIPAIDYSASISKIKALSTNTYYTSMLTYLDRFNNHVKKLSEQIESTKNIDI